MRVKDHKIQGVGCLSREMPRRDREDIFQVSEERLLVKEVKGRSS